MVTVLHSTLGEIALAVAPVLRQDVAAPTDRVLSKACPEKPLGDVLVGEDNTARHFDSVEAIDVPPENWSKFCESLRRH